MNHEYFYEYMGVTIRPIAHSDLEMLREWRNDESNNKFLRKVPYITREMQESWYTSYLKDTDVIMFMIEIEDPAVKTVGSISLYDFSDKEKCELGKVIVGDPGSHNKGIGTRAVVAATRLAIEQLGVQEVFLHVNRENIAAVKSYQRAGYEVSCELPDNEQIMSCRNSQ